MNEVVIWTILAGALLTYLTRVGGYLVMSRFQRIHPRVEAALDAVPAAVLTTIVAPAAYNGGPAELVALAIAGALAWRGMGMLGIFLAGGATLLALRHVAGL